jgi:hypothetical protein
MFMVDIDAVKQGDSSTEGELEATLRTGDEILGWMDSILGVDRSYCLAVMSGNGTQLLMRGTLDLEDAGLARILLHRMKGRWPSVDLSGWMPSIGPAMPGTRKCKGVASLERPHRVVSILEQWEGERQLTIEDLTRLIESLPEVPLETLVVHQPRKAWDEWSAVGDLDIEEVSQQHFGERRICPVCKATDGSVGIVERYLVTCQRRLKCPAASVGKTGFTAIHVYGMVLGHGWGPYTQEQKLEIVEAAKMDWKLEWQEEDEKIVSDETIAALVPGVAAMFEREPDRHCSVVPEAPWILRSTVPGHVADQVALALKKAYCPDFVNQRTLVLCGRLYCYHQGLGIWVKISPTQDIDRVARIINDQAYQGIWCNDEMTGKMRRLAPATRPVMDALEYGLPQPKFFQEGRIGLACRDGFLELLGDRWVPRPHHPDNRARGRVSKTCAAVLQDIESGAASEAVKALREILVKTLQGESPKVDGLLALFLEQIGAVICRVRPELRNALFLHGAPDTGKSSLLQIAEAMAERIGLTVTGTSLSTLNDNFPDECLLGSDINIVQEEGAFDGSRGVPTSRLKQIVEGSQWSFPRKNRSNIQVKFDLLWMSSSNSEPVFAENSTAIVKRAYIVEYPGQRVENLDRGMIPRFLHQHLDGIIAASLVGAARLSLMGRTVLPVESEIVKHTQEIGRTESLVEAWYRTVEISESLDDDAILEDALKACNRWGELHGFRKEAASNNPIRFGIALKKISGRKSRSSHGKTFVAVKVARDGWEGGSETSNGKSREMNPSML